ncbi:MAG TPA: YfhO family protein [Gemmatimonadales bacterium]|nr:YfhO family protein [Gemmatimonadales bacterium]
MTTRPRFPTLTVAIVFALAVAVAFWPFWTGQFLINPSSDMRNGYPFRLFAADYLRAYRAFPQWNPYLFGGLPFIGAIGGDVFYPTFLLRLALPVDAGITLGFMIHVALAGVFMFLFLRTLGLEWGAAFVGGAAYMFSGQVVSLVSPGHDGKLFVSALLPLVLLFLYQAVVRNDWRRYAYFGALVGLCLLSPHFQATYYVLMAAGFFWAFLVFVGDARPREGLLAAPWWRSALLFGLALALAFAVAAIQLVPFRDYLAFAARGAAKEAGDRWAYATSWAMPPEELVNVLWPAFSGMLDEYWGRNFFKLHSEYLGAAVLVLATCAGYLRERRRLVWFFVFLAVYGILFALGGHTPFYHIPYAILPGIKLTRAPSIIFFLTSFSVAALAGLGAQALLAAAPTVPKTVFRWWAGVAGVAVVLAFAGAFENIMRGVADPERIGAVAASYPAFRVDVVRVLVVILAASALCLARLGGRLSGLRWSILIGVLVLLDLWSVERRYIRFGPPASESFAPDAVVRMLQADSGLYRVLSLNEYHGLENYFMAHRIRTVLGYHGNELNRYDELLGGKNEWRNIGNLNILRLLAVRYVIVDRPVGDTTVLVPVGSGPLTTLDGQTAYVYRVKAADPYAYLVRQALQLGDGQTIPVILNGRFDPRRLMIVPPGEGAGETTLPTMPDSETTPVAVREARPGAFRFELDHPTGAPCYLFVSENYYPAWHATVDGKAAPVLRAQYSLLAVPLPAGAHAVELRFSSPAYAQGKAITLGALALLIGIVAVDAVQRRRQTPGG